MGQQPPTFVFRFLCLAIMVTCTCTCGDAPSSPVTDPGDDTPLPSILERLETLQAKFDDLQLKNQKLEEEIQLIGRKTFPLAGPGSNRLGRRYARDAPQQVCKEGKAGRDGRDGRDGQPGPVGPQGKDGFTAHELEQVLERVLDSRSSFNTLQAEAGIYKKGNGTGGAVYVRWGRTSCPEHAQLIYSGYAASSHYTHTGGGSTKICLPSEPQWNSKTAGFQSGGHIYGSEYEVSGNNPFSTENTRGHPLHDADVVCSVCLAVSRFSHVMIPARKECPAGWVKEYGGYLTTAHQGHKKSSYDCMDYAPEVLNSGTGNANGALFYVVEAACGSLPCPPYSNGYELTCVVCTR